jgi:uncharacterized protein (TIGR02145 family)
MKKYKEKIERSPKAIIRCQKTKIKQSAFYFIFLISLTTYYCFSQTSISTTGNAPDNSAILDISSSNRGLLLNRMTTDERNSIVSPAASLLIFNTSTNCFEAYVNGGWFALSCPLDCTPPAAPQANSAANLSCTSFTANWNSSTGVTAYYIDVSTDNGFTGFVPGFNNLYAGNSASFTITGLSNASSYYYRLRAEKNCMSSNSNIITVVTNSCWTCGNILTDSRDGGTYTTVPIGSQCWMSQNLNYGTYALPSTNAQAPRTKYCQNLSGPDPTCVMGGLYEWANMMNGGQSCNGTGPGSPGCSSNVQGLCPSGWHIPSHYEWTQMEQTICVSGDCNNVFPYDEVTYGWRGTYEGGMIKVTPICGSLPCWVAPNPNATNSTHFNALPCGYSQSGSFTDVGEYSGWWSTTKTSNGNTAWGRQLFSGDSKIVRGYNFLYIGFPVRCLKN